MRLKILLPTRILLDRDVDKVTADALNGQFCLLPRHVDFVAPLVPGILSYVDSDRQTRHIGIDEGILVKAGDEVLVTTRQATQGAALEELKDRVAREFRPADEQERKVRSASARLEAGLVRRFLDVQDQNIA